GHYVTKMTVPAADGNVPANVNAAVNAPVTPSEEAPLVGTYDNAGPEMITADAVEKSDATTVVITGEAVGNWYFEASFPVEIKDSANNLIGVGYAQAQGDWMVTTPVPFISTVTLNAPYSGPATVILHKDNPSGEPMFDASVSYDVTL